ncbi:MAG: hypothetical protein ABFD75_07585 [Smithella sp.]
MKKIIWSIFKNNLPCFASFVLLFCLLCIGGCTGSLYSVNMNYEAFGVNIPSSLRNDNKNLNSAITVAEFTDARKVDDPIVIGHVVEKDGMKVLVVPKYAKPTQAVSTGIKRYLAKAGYKIYNDTRKWDQKEAAVPKAGSKLVIGGTIDQLELTCRKGFPTDSYKAVVKLTLVLTSPANGNVLYRSSVESNTALEHVSFSEARLEEQLNIALGDAIEKIFEDIKLAQKIKETLAQK